MGEVRALPNFAVPNDEPIAEIVAMLEDALFRAQNGEIIGCALVLAPRGGKFTRDFCAEQMSSHDLAAGCLSLIYSIGKHLSDE